MAKVVKVMEVSEISIGDAYREVPSGAGEQLVGRTTVQELTNKTLSSPVITGETVNHTAATLAIAPATHAGRIVTLNRAAGVTVTLPTATGSGNHYRFIVGTTVTSNQHRFDVTGDDAYFGILNMLDLDGSAAAGFAAGSDADRIDLNGTTKGGTKGDFIEFVDIAADTWFVTGNLQVPVGSNPASPFTTGAVS